MSTPSPAERPETMDRRGFLARATRWSLLTLAGAALGVDGVARAAEPGFMPPPYPRPPLPGACIEAATPVEKTLAAVLETVVPGLATDPDGEPGAIESCAMNLMVDGAYPFRGYASLIATLMDSLAKKSHERPFLELDPDARLAVLVEAQESLPLLRLAYRAIRSTFYGGAYNGVGLGYLGYPGPNLGYRHLPEASFRVPISEEMTEEGWMP